MRVRIANLETMSGLIKEMTKIYRMARNNEIDTLDGVRFVQILREIRATAESADVEKRLEALEAKK